MCASTPCICHTCWDKGVRDPCPCVLEVYENGKSQGAADVAAASGPPSDAAKPGVRLDTESNRWYDTADHIYDDATPVAWRRLVGDILGLTDEYGANWSDLERTEIAVRLTVLLQTAHPEDAPGFLHACSYCGYTAICSAHQRPDPTCGTCFGERAKEVEDAPGGPWEGLARELWGAAFNRYGSCYFCGRSVGHNDDCEWRDALNREVRDRLRGDETDAPK